MNKADVEFVFGAEPRQAVEYLQGKGYNISWDWRDTEKQAHARAFTIAKMTEMDLLQDTHKMLTKALKEGWTEKEFQDKAGAMFQKRGWWGVQERVNPKTGEVEKVQLGSPYRLRTIYRTNMQTAYQAGHYKNQYENAANRPYWEYNSMNDQRTRPEHAALNGKICRYDDPFWQKYYPPNGWGCRCYVRAYREDQVKDRKIGTDLRPKVDEGWDYNPGQAWHQPDLDKYTYEIAKNYTKGIVTGAAFKLFYDNAKAAKAGMNKAMPVAVINKESRSALKAKGQTVLLSEETMIKQTQAHPDLTLEDYHILPDVVDAAQCIINKNGQNLVFIKRNNKYYFAVVKATKDKKELFLTSFRFTNLEDIRTEAQKGEVIKNELF